MNTNFEGLSESELETMIEKASRALKERQQEKRKEVLNEIKQLASSIGVTVEIIEGQGATSRKGRKVPIKYQNPSNLSDKWSGRGVRPKWLQALISQGRRLEEFEVKL